MCWHIFIFEATPTFVEIYKTIANNRNNKHLFRRHTKVREVQFMQIKKTTTKKNSIKFHYLCQDFTLNDKKY